MLFALFYVLAIVILIMHFTGFLARHNIEWLVLVSRRRRFPGCDLPLKANLMLLPLSGKGGSGVRELEVCGNRKGRQRRPFLFPARGGQSSCR
jgi:hypothetical protein